MHAWLGNFVSEIPCGRPVAARFYGRALPEMLHFRDSREIMYEVPLFLFPFCRSLSILTHRLRRFPYGKSRFVTYNSAGRWKGKEEEERMDRTEKQFSENEPRMPAATDSLLYSSLSRCYPTLFHSFPLSFYSFPPSFLSDCPINHKTKCARNDRNYWNVFYYWTRTTHGKRLKISHWWCNLYLPFTSSGSIRAVIGKTERSEGKLMEIHML